MHPFEDLIRNVPDFPKQGIMFKDISPLLKEKFPDVIRAMGEKIPWKDIDVVVGVESRGFILGAAMASEFNKGFIPVRKKGKLPPPVKQVTYQLEYGQDILEMALNDKPARVLIVDDVLATGGTLKAVMELCKDNKFDVKGLSVLINLTFLNQFKKEAIPLFSVLDY